MGFIEKSARLRRLGRPVRSNTIPNHLAASLVGQTVSLLGHGHTILHGIVAGVLNETGRPKLIVNRHEYDLNQVLSVTPPMFN
ncbi:MAG TPA: hypothetical protein VL793_06845 [Patescibacteria group bacterium]|nr:hypothetical protein [Patescibacteria group bacterium]